MCTAIMLISCPELANKVQSQWNWQSRDTVPLSRQKELTPFAATSRATPRQSQEVPSIFTYSGNSSVVLEMPTPLAFPGKLRTWRLVLCVNLLVCTKEAFSGMCASLRGGCCQDGGRKSSLSGACWCEHAVSSLAQQRPVRGGGGAAGSSGQQNTQRDPKQEI